MEKKMEKKKTVKRKHRERGKKTTTKHEQPISASASSRVTISTGFTKRQIKYDKLYFATILD